MSTAAGMRPVQQQQQQQHMPPDAYQCRLCASHNHVTADCPMLEDARPAASSRPDMDHMQVDNPDLSELNEDFWTAEPSQEVKVRSSVLHSNISDFR